MCVYSSPFMLFKGLFGAKKGIGTGTGLKKIKLLKNELRVNFFPTRIVFNRIGPKRSLCPPVLEVQF